jgi:Yip1 domain
VIHSEAASARASARLGLTLRTVLISPRDGFRAAFQATDRRERAGRHPAEGLAPFLLAALAGAALFMLWLKVGGLFGWRESPRSQFRSEFLVGALITGALLGLAGQALWSVAGRHAVRALGGRASGRDLRTVWGAAGFPQVLSLALLLPLDLLIVGPATFTTERLTDSVATAWAALSIALSAALALWSLWLFVRGVETASGMGTARALAGTLFAGLCLAASVAVPVFFVALLWKPA